MELNAAEALLYELSKQTKTQQRLAIYDRLVNIEDDEVDLYESLAKLASAWIPSTIDDAIGPEGEVRVKAVLLLGLLVDDPNYVAQNTVASLLRDITKKKVAPALKKMTAPMGKVVGTDVSYVIRFWTIMIRLLGPALHQGASVLNCMLDVIQPCFMQADVKILSKSYGAWRALIDNFAADPNWTQKTVDKMDSNSTNRRVDLIMKVLRAAPCKSDMVAIEKFRTWWHLAASLGPKLESYFDMVCQPLLRFCVGGQLELLNGLEDGTLTKVGEPMDANQIKSYALSGENEKEKPMTKPLPLFPAAQAATLEVIARFLGMDFESKLGPLPSVCFSKPETVRQHTVFIVQCLRQWSLFAEKPTSKCAKHAIIMPKIWAQIMSTIERCRKSMSGDEERIVFTHFMAQVHAWIAETGQSFDIKYRSVIALQACELVSRRDYQGKWTWAGLVQSLMKKSAEIDSETLSELLAKMLDAVGQSNEDLQLKRIEHCLETLASFPEALSFGTVTSKWQNIASFVVTLLRKTNEVNQGTKTNADFSCAYQLLCFPLIQANRRQDLDMTDVKFFSAQWKTLYTEIQRCISLETMTNDSTCCDELCKKLIEMQFDLQNTGVVYLLADCLKTVVDAFETSTLKTNENFSDSQFRPLGGFLTCVQMLASVTQSLAPIAAHATEESDDDDKRKNLIALASAAIGGVLGTVTRLLDRLENSGAVISCLELLAAPLATTLTASNDKSTATVFKLHLTKLDQCITSVAEGLKSRYGGPFDSTLLSQIFPIFSAGLKHSRRQIRNEIVNLWQDTFAQQSTLTYPNELKGTLESVMEKLGLSCPSLGTQTKTKAPSLTASRPSMGDTMPIIDEDEFYDGLNIPVPKAATPKRTKPEEPVLTDFGHLNGEKSSARKRKQPFTDEKEEEFVVVQPSKRHKKMALTEHQKEKLTQNSAMPFMDRAEESQSQICVEKRLPPEFTLDSQPATQSSLSDDNVVNETTDSLMTDEREKTDSPSKTQPNNDSESLFDNPIVTNGRHADENKEESKRSSVLGKSKSVNFDQPRTESPDVVFSSQPVDASHAKKMSEFLSPARPLKAKKTMGGGSKGAPRVEVTARDQAAAIAVEQASEKDWPVVELGDSLSNDKENPEEAIDDEDVSLDEEDEDQLADAKKNRRKSKTPVKIKLDHPKNKKKTPTVKESAKKPKAKRSVGRPATKKSASKAESKANKGKQTNGQYSRVVVDDSDAEADENGHLTDDTDPMLLVEEQPEAVNPQSLSLFDSLAMDGDANELVVVVADDSLMETTMEDHSSKLDKSAELEQFPNDDEEEDYDKQLIIMPDTPNGKADGNSSDEVLKLKIPNEWTPGILKKAKTRRPPTPPSTGGQFRHVHFAASDDEMQRSPTKSEGNVKGPRRQKRCNTPPPSFTALFQPRTLDMVMKARAKSGSALVEQNKEMAATDQQQNGMGDVPMCSDASLASNQSILVADARLNRSDPFFPALVDCQLPIGDISRKLTTSSWDHGLKCLLASKKIHTVGDLARLSEVDINRLPFVVPKVANAHRVLSELRDKLAEQSSAPVFLPPRQATPPPDDNNKPDSEDTDTLTSESPQKIEPATEEKTVEAEEAATEAEVQLNGEVEEEEQPPTSEGDEPLRSLESAMHSAMDDFERFFDVDVFNGPEILAADELCDRLFNRFSRVQTSVKQKMRELLLRSTAAVVASD